MSVYGKVVEHGLATAEEYQGGDDDWETDPEPQNDISEKEQRWGAAHLPSDAKEITDMRQLRNAVKEQDEESSKREYEEKRREVADSYGERK